MQTRMVMEQNERMAGSVPVRGLINEPVLTESSVSASTSSVIGKESFAAKIAAASADAAPSATPSKGTPASAGEAVSSLGFSDFIDVINPFQHIPIVSAIYRHITGDEISPVSEVAGGGIYGGPIGAVLGAASAAVRYAMNAPQGDTAQKENTSEFAKVLKSVAQPPSDTTIAVADLRQDYTAYNA